MEHWRYYPCIGGPIHPMSKDCQYSSAEDFKARLHVLSRVSLNVEKENPSVLPNIR
jgi:hypothetical protein